MAQDQSRVRYKLVTSLVLEGLPLRAMPFAVPGRRAGARRATWRDSTVEDNPPSVQIHGTAQHPRRRPPAHDCMTTVSQHRKSGS
jgi:hypothetical protein